MNRKHEKAEPIRMFSKKCRARLLLFGVAAAVLTCLCWLSFMDAVGRVQEELNRARVLTIIDSAALFVPSLLDEPDVLRDAMRSLVLEYAAVQAVRIVAPHGPDWRVYLTDTGDGEGAIERAVPEHYARAYADPSRTFRAGEGQNSTSVRALANGGSVQSLIVVTHRLSAADRTAAYTTLTYLGGLALLLLVLVLVLGGLLLCARALGHSGLRQYVQQQTGPEAGVRA